MKTLLSTFPGGPDSLVLKEIETPHPQSGEILVKVKAAGVNFPDTLIIKDLYQIKPQRPFAPGGEISGVIAAIGEDVNNFSEGDRVVAVPGFGGFATHVVVPVSQVTKIPDTMSFEDAACFLFTYCTSHYALRDRAQLEKNETLLITGAAGGVGVAAIEIAKAIGAKVIAAVSSEIKADFCKEIGADETIIYPKNMDRDSQKALSGKVKKIVGTSGVDVVYDSVGGNYSEPFLRAIAWNGRFLVVGFPAGIPKIPLNLPLLKSCQIVGVFWGSFTTRYPAQHQKYLSELFDLYEDGRIKPRITKSFPLKNAAQALFYISERKALGKAVITFD